MSERNEIDQAWSECLKIMENKLGRPTFEMCLKNTRVLSYDETKLFIGVCNKFAKSWLQGKYLEIISRTFQNLLGKKYDLDFSVMDQNNDSENKEQNNKYGFIPSGIGTFAPAVNKTNYSSGTLNPKYTFDSFVVGKSNQFVHAASLAVAESPAKAYNPLFIYGGVGLGKTHLMHAIGNYIISKNSNFKVVYITTEQFTNELINSIRQHQTVLFRNKYRNVDILLIDDIQFIAGKESTQEEFFHTFNELHGANKQIIITSDRPPKEIHTIEARLLSRFEWGLTADIQRPDIETREAILRKKGDSEKVFVPNEVTNLIAEKITANIRELEGALVKVIAYASLNKCEINLQTAKEALKNLIDDSGDNKITIQLIQKAVCEYYGIKQNQLVSEKRDQKYALPRQIAMYLSKDLTGFSLPQIGKEFGGKDHTTVLHACRKISNNMKNPAFANAIENIKMSLSSGN